MSESTAVSSHTEMDVEKFKEPSSTYHMLGGDDPHSYAQNSEYQVIFCFKTCPVTPIIFRFLHWKSQKYIVTMFSQFRYCVLNMYLEL